MTSGTYIYSDKAVKRLCERLLTRVPKTGPLSDTHYDILQAEAALTELNQRVNQVDPRFEAAWDESRVTGSSTHTS